MIRKSLLVGLGLFGLIAVGSVASATPASAGYACGPWNGWCAYYGGGHGWYGYPTNRFYGGGYGYKRNWYGNNWYGGGNNWYGGGNYYKGHGNKGYKAYKGGKGKHYSYKKNYKHYR